MTNNAFTVPWLEEWFRRYYYTARFDVGSSGVEAVSFADLRRLTGLGFADLDELVFTDGHTFGGDALRQSIARRWGDGDFASTMVTHGSSEAIFLIMNALLRADDEVVVLDPVYHQLAAVPRAIGCRLKRWELLPQEDFRADLNRLRDLVTAKTRMIIVNFPHNPTGTTVSEPDMRAIVDIASRCGAYLFWDNAFGDLTYAHAPLPSPHLLYDRAIVVGTLSKAYGLPGLRVGWCLANPDVLSRCVALRDNLTLHLSPLNELVARHAIDSGDILVSAALKRASANLHALQGWAQSQPEDIGWIAPRAGVCAFVEIKRHPNVEDFCARLAQQEDVLLVPGTCFGDPRRVRLGFGGSSESLHEGLSRISRALERVAA